MQAQRSFHGKSISLSIVGMKTISEIRLENLEALIVELGTAEAVAKRAETSAIYLSQIRNKAVDRKTKKTRQIGDPLARKLETGCDKERGWMDHEHLPLSYRQQRIQQAAVLMEHMEDWQLDQTIKIVDTLAKPVQQQGNGNG